MILYKYCDLEGISLISNCEIKMPYISKLNDPFESLPKFVFGETNEGRVLKRVSAAAKRKNVNLPYNFEENTLRDLKSGKLKKDFIAFALAAVQELKETSCLVSVSEDPKNILMWAHYAKSHRGIVIGIDFDNLWNGKGLKMHPVLYSHARVEIDTLIDPEEKAWEKQFDNIVCCKAISWGYEKEYRSAMPKSWLEKFSSTVTEKRTIGGEETWFLKFNASAIKEVIFGLETTKGIKEQVLALKSTKEFAHLCIKEVIISPTNFEFDIRNL